MTDETPLPTRRAVMRLIRLPGFVRLQSATFINGIGGWMLAIALPLYVLRETGSPLQTATALAVEIVVDLVIGQVAGVFVDRWNRRVTFAIVSVLQAAALFPLLAVPGAHPRIWIIYPVAAVGSALSSLSGPSVGALFPAVIPRDLRVQGNSLGGLITDSRQLLGGAAGGLALGTLGLSAVVWVDALTFVAAAVLLAWPLGVVERVARDETEDRTSRLAEWREGITVARNDRRLVGVMIVAFVIVFGQGLFLVLFAVFAVGSAHLSDAQAGVMRAVVGAGAIAGGVLLTAFGARFTPRALAVGGLIGTGATMFLAWNGPYLHAPLAYYLVVFALAGVPNVISYVGMATIFQNATPMAMMGRVFSLLSAVMSVATLLGMLVAGLVTEKIPPALALNLQATSFIAGAVAGWWLLREPVGSVPSQVTVISEAEVSRT